MSNGLNDYAANSEMREGLRRPFEPKLISKLPATPKRPALDYVSHAAVTDRLNREAPSWTFELTRFMEFTDDKGLPHVMAVYGSMTIGSVTRWEVGEADGLDNYGREMKGAISDFIRRAAMRFGVALDLWAKESIYEESSDTATAASSKTLAAGSPRSGSVPPASSGASEDGPGASDEPRPTQSAAETRLDDTAEGEPLSGSAPLGSGGGGGSPTNYLTKDDQGLLKAEYGGQVAALKAYKARFGDRITRLADITYEMRDEMGAA